MLEFNLVPEKELTPLKELVDRLLSKDAGDGTGAGAILAEGGGGGAAGSDA